MQKGIEFLQPSERQMKIVGSFWVNPVTYEVVQDRGKTPWNFEIMIDRTDDQFDQIHFKCPDVPYFQRINRIDYMDGYMRFKKSEYEDLKNHVDFLMRALNPYAGRYKD